MYKIRLVFLITISSLFLNCKAFEFDCKNEVKEYQWDAYIQAIQAAAPYIAQGKDVLLLSGINCRNRFEQREYYILTSDYDIIRRRPTRFKETIINSALTERDNTYITTFFDNTILINTLNRNASYDLEGMFDPINYPDCFITESERKYQYEGEYFFAMITRDGKVHGATHLFFCEELPVNKVYWALMFNVMLHTDDPNAIIIKQSYSPYNIVNYP